MIFKAVACTTPWDKGAKLSSERAPSAHFSHSSDTLNRLVFFRHSAPSYYFQFPSQRLAPSAAPLNLKTPVI